MRIRFSAHVQNKLKQLKKKNPQLFHKVHKQTKLFSTTPRHPSLRIHKLSGNLDNMWSLSIDKKTRMVYLRLNSNEVYFIDIGTHDQVYKK